MTIDRCNVCPKGLVALHLGILVCSVSSGLRSMSSSEGVVDPFDQSLESFQRDGAYSGLLPFRIAK